LTPCRIESVSKLIKKPVQGEKHSFTSLVIFGGAGGDDVTQGRKLLATTRIRRQGAEDKCRFKTPKAYREGRMHCRAEKETR